MPPQADILAIDGNSPDAAGNAVLDNHVRRDKFAKLQARKRLPKAGILS